MKMEATKAIQQEPARILGRIVATELSQEEIDAISGGGTSCSGGKADDCTQNQM
jgi:hypothetical protein